MPPLLRIRDLSVAFPGRERELVAVRGLSLEVAAGEVVGLVGESGSGKSLTALAVLGLVPPPGAIRAGSIELAGRELRGLSETEYRAVRGARIGLVFQEPGAALNPVLTIGTQIVEAMRAHRPLSRRAARERAIELLDRLAIPDARERMRSYPHELSGGQKQRALLAVALAADPELLLADEPTTALDVTVQAQVLDLLDRLRRERGLGILLITHDLGVVARSCDRLVVLYAGEVVEQGPTAEVLRDPAHPYTRGLLASVPRLGETANDGALATIPGVVPSLAERPAGCPFHPRCGDRRPECDRVEPPWVALGGSRGARCVLLAPEAKAG
ncbi:MAG: ABC transporter ATP-binding protein [Thermoanaerobaculia bacterium]|nr:ABC transporter ATP-binding protein [Thermoanaerobaculia bacterium]